MLKFCIKILFCRRPFRLLNTFMRKAKDPDPDPYLRLLDPDPGGLKPCGSCGSGSGSPTLLKMKSLKRRTYHVLRSSRRISYLVQFVFINMKKTVSTVSFTQCCDAELRPIKSFICVKIYVGDPWHFGVDPDPRSILWLIYPDPGGLETCGSCGSGSGSGSGTLVSRGEPTMSSVAAEAAASILSTRPGMSFAILPSIDSRYIGN